MLLSAVQSIKNIKVITKKLATRIKEKKQTQFAQHLNVLLWLCMPLRNLHLASVEAAASTEAETWEFGGSVTINVDENVFLKRISARCIENKCNHCLQPHSE